MSSTVGTCCVCFEEENILACICCDRCNDGILCLDCSDEIDDTMDDFVFKCPVCRSILISHSLHTIVLVELNYATKQTDNNSLINRWIENSTHPCVFTYQE